MAISNPWRRYHGFLRFTEAGNQHVVFQDFLIKFPIVVPIQDQKAIRIARLLVEEVVSLFGVPEALLSDRDTDLLSHLMQGLCKILGIKRLNTTAYHPQCDGMVEKFLKTKQFCVSMPPHVEISGTATCLVHCLLT